MHHRTTASGRSGPFSFRRRRPPAVLSHPGVFLGVAAAGALMVNVVTGAEPVAQAEAGASEPVSVAQQLGLTASAGEVDLTRDLDPLEDLAASRSARDAAQAAAARAQAAADKAEVARQRAEARAKARAEARARAAAEAKAATRAAAAAPEAESAAVEAPEVPEESPGPVAAASGSTAVSVIAQITNSAGPVTAVAQAAADAVVSNVPGAAAIHLGGTRPSAADPGGHPSGNAVDYMVMSDAALGDAIVQYHIANWDTLGVDYIIWQQRYLASPGGGWSSMADRGSSTANHMDHPHVNYRG